MKHGVLYRCQNPDSRLKVEKSPISLPKSDNPICTCGAPMKKVYTKPSMREMSKEEAARILPEAFPDIFLANPGKSR